MHSTTSVVNLNLGASLQLHTHAHTHCPPPLRHSRRLSLPAGSWPTPYGSPPPRSPSLPAGS